MLNATLLFIPAFNEIMDGKPQGNLHNEVYRIANEVDGVINTEKCIVRKMGLEYIVDLHVRVSGDISVKEGHKISHQVKSRLMDSPLSILEVNIHIEPND